MKIEKDKVKHFSVCFLITSLAGVYGVCLATGASLGKEYGDKNAPGNCWSWADLLADALGIIVGYMLNRLIVTLCF
ncbi:hypothetical protein [Bacteroides cellulosilyticus]|jgi:hypothetical protein|uniref:hypothetical protein n=1 Tax=Bacteroides cellulosilyticus TaxID=246787 RepID=UPI00101D0BBE|nr:hypothetical protein [Bacteroides cellulosilyticus]